MKKGSIVLYQGKEYKIVGLNSTHLLIANNEGACVASQLDCEVIREFVPSVKEGDRAKISKSAFNEEYEGYAFGDSFASDENGECVAIVLADQSFVVAPVVMLDKNPGENTAELVTSDSDDSSIHGSDDE